MENCKPRPLVLHIIYALGTGGLENGLVNIINNPESRRYRHAIICLTERSPFSKRIMAEDVEIIELRKRPGHDFGLYLRLLKALRTLKPAVVHTSRRAGDAAVRRIGDRQESTVSTAGTSTTWMAPAGNTAPFAGS